MASPAIETAPPRGKCEATRSRSVICTCTPDSASLLCTAKGRSPPPAPTSSADSWEQPHSRAIRRSKAVVVLIPPNHSLMCRKSVSVLAISVAVPRSSSSHSGMTVRRIIAGACETGWPNGGRWLTRQHVSASQIYTRGIRFALRERPQVDQGNEHTAQLLSGLQEPTCSGMASRVPQLADESFLPCAVIT